MTSELLANIERYEQAAADLRALISEAHSAIKDVRIVLKEIDGAAASIRQEFEGDIRDRVYQFLDGQLVPLGDGLRELVDRAAQDIMRQFDALEKKLFIGRNGVDLRDLIERMADQQFFGMDGTPTMHRMPSGKRVGDSTGRSSRPGRKTPK